MADIAEQLSRVVCRHPVTVSADTTIMAAMAAMSRPAPARARDEPDLEQHLRAAATCVVVLEQNHVLGLLTAREMVGFAAQQRPLAQLTVSEVLTQTITLRESELTGFPALLNFFEQHQISHLPILDDQGQLTGLISHQSLLTGLQSWLDEQPVAIEQDANGKMRELADSPMNEIETSQEIEQELIRKQNYLEALLNNIPHITWMKDENSRFIAVNQPFAQASATTPDALVGKTDLDIYPADIAQAYRKDDREVLQSNQRKVIEEKFVRADGTVSWIETTKTPFRDADGNIAGTVGIAADITERRQIEAALAESEAKFRRLVEGGQDLTWSTDAQGRFTYLSPQFKDLSGWETSDWIGRKCSEVVYLADRAWVLDAHTALARESSAGALEFRLNHREENYVWVCLNSTPILNAAGELVGQQGTLTNINARKKAELALQESQTQFHRMTENVPGMIFRYVLHSDGADELTYVSSQSREVCEVEPEMALKNAASLWERIHPDDVSWLGDAIRASADTLQPFTSAYRLCLPEKGPRWVQNMTHVERLDNGDVVWDGIVVDITDRKAAEMALKESKRRYASLTAAAPVGIARFDASMRCTYLNERWSEMTGRSIESGLGDGWIEAIHPDDREKLANAWTESTLKTPLETIYLSGWEGRHLLPDGTITWFEVHSAREFDDAGNVVGYVSVVTDITERKGSEQQLDRLSERLSLALESASIGIWEWDSATQKLIWDDRMFSLYGVEPTDFSGQYEDWLRQLHPEDLARMSQQEKAQLQEQGAAETEFRIIRPNGEVRYIYSNVITQYTGQNDLVRMIGLNMDITDRKQADHQLQALSERLELAIQSAKIGIWELDYVTGRLSWDGQMCAIYGIQPEDFGGTCQDWSERIHPDDLAQAQPDALKPDNIYDTEFRVIRPDGSIRWVMAFAFTQQDEQGELTRAVGVNLDISDRKQAELALEQELLRRNAIFNTSSDGIHILDRSGNLIEANESFARMLGYSSEEVRHLNLNDWDVNFTREELRVKLEMPLEYFSEASVIDETLNRRKDGWIFPVEVSVRAMEWNGEISFICISRDISERKQAEVQLQRTNEELARATRLKDEFLANMSHELRTPLNVILGWSEALRDQILGPLDEKQIKALKTVEASGSHLLRLINDILDVAKIESGKVVLDKRPADIAYICNSGIVFVKQQAIRKNVQIITKIPNELPKIVVDERRILQVLINLLDNAVKFTPKRGKITLEVRCCGQKNHSEKVSNQVVDKQNSTNEFIEIAISDTGIGISSEDVSRLFQPFVQVDSALNREYTGTGLGLALVKRITKLHGGSIDLSSEVGVGSCFSIKLPCETTSVDLMSDSSQEEVETNAELISSNSTNSSLILIAEDNEDNANMLVSYLEFKGYRILVAPNGAEAIELAEKYCPDLILMDIQMPKINGIEATKIIRQTDPIQNIPIVALTALAMKGDEDKILAAGANYYLSKPIKLKQLNELIPQILESTVGKSEEA